MLLYMCIICPFCLHALHSCTNSTSVHLELKSATVIWTLAIYRVISYEKEFLQNVHTEKFRVRIRVRVSIRVMVRIRVRFRVRIRTA